MNTGGQYYSPGGNAIRIRSSRQAESIQAARGSVQRSAPKPNPSNDIPHLANLPVLDGDASVFASRPASGMNAMNPPRTSPDLPIARSMRRRPATLDLRAQGLSPPRPGTAPVNVSINFASLFSNLNLRGGSTSTPPRNNAATPGPATAPRPAAAAAAERPARTTRKLTALERGVQARQLIRVKQSTTDRFFHYHAGLDQWASWDRGRRRLFFQRIPIPPRQGEWPGHPALRPGEQLRELSKYEKNIRRLGKDASGGARGGVRRVFERVKRGLIGFVRGRHGRGQGDGDDDSLGRVNGLKAQLAEGFEAAGIQFKRRLGQGGYGAVFLFELVGENGAKYPIVVKGSTREPRDDLGAFDKEIRHLTSMNGAAHFVQRVFLQDLPLPAVRKRRSIRAALAPGTGLNPGYTEEELQALQTARWEIDNSRDLILLENMPRGDMIDLIIKLVNKNRRLSNRALWAIFECLFKGCVGMATPGRFHQAGLDPNAHAMAEVDETAPDWLQDGSQQPTQPMVHFDLDPQNALVGNFGGAGGPHENVPIVKIADPGLAIIVDDNVRNDETKLWLLRAQGKPDYLFPEQFTHEWEYTAAIDLLNLAAQPTAGNYNWWSNLYQIGWIMWALVTHCFPPMPPRPWPYRYASEEYGVDGDVSGFTYGMHIMGRDFDYCDMELRRQILRCLDHDATKRPKIGWLEAVFLFNSVRPDLLQAESDEQLRAHMQDIYGNP